MEVEFDMSCKVTIDLNIDKYNIKNISNNELVEELKKYIECCTVACKQRLNIDGEFENIKVNKIKILPEVEIENTLEDIALRKYNKKSKKY